MLSVLLLQKGKASNYVKPGNPDALSTILECMDATNTLMQVSAISTSFKKLTADANALLDSQGDSGCETEGENLVCSFDYSTVESDFKSVCESNDGVYDEYERQVTCPIPDDPSLTANFIVRGTNFPTCFSSACQPSDIERWISQGVELLEFDVEKGTDLVCDSHYQIEVTITQAPKAVSGSCPTRQSIQGHFTTLALALVVISALLGVTW